MLVLTRRAGEVIVIDGLIRVKMLTEGPAVRLGIVAPASVRIMRAELVRPPALLTAAERDAELCGDAARPFVRGPWCP
jgi:carbon storage regulator CsrA